MRTTFRSQTEKHELSHLYEAKIRNMGNAVAGQTALLFLQRFIRILKAGGRGGIVNLGKTNPLNDAGIAEFVALQKTFADSPKRGLR